MKANLALFSSAFAIAACHPDVGGSGADGSVSDDRPVADTGGDQSSVTWPIADLDDVALVLVVGDSIAAGYNAANNNAPGGQGYARLVVDNHSIYPDWATRNIRALASDVQFRSLARSGATSTETATAVRRDSPPPVDGDVLVLINVGGNDFNDSAATMLSASLTAQAAATLRSNLADIVTRLRARYEDVSMGQRVVFAIDNIHDPTDGTGMVPSQYDDGFCSMLANPMLAPFRQQVLANLATMNAAIAAEAAAQHATLVDFHAAFMGHGMASSDMWISNDCAHPTSVGHHHLRAALWTAIAGP